VTPGPVITTLVDELPIASEFTALIWLPILTV
jgi:hypothetical protein